MGHIGIDVRLATYRMGGIPTYMRKLVQTLEKLDTQNRYTVFHSRKAQESLVTRFQNAKLWTPAHHRIERLALSIELLRHRLDLYHSPDFIPPMRGGKKHVITVHDLTFIHYPQFIADEGRRYYTDQIQMAVRQADHIFSVSEATRQDLIAILNVPADKITVHWNGVDEKFRPLPEHELAQVQQALSLPQEYILFVGTLEPRKNIVGLLEAYRKLRDILPDAPPIVIVGRKGWLFEKTEKRIQALNLNKHILWRDNVSDDQLPAVYNGALVEVMPSFYEGFGLPALEAMACGTVPIVSNRSSLPEIVGDVGLLIDPDDPQTITKALHKSLTDTVWREQMSQAGIQQAAQFTWDRTANIVLNTYQALL